MTGTTERGGPQAGRHIDDSAVVPSAKAESPPLKEERDPDWVRFRVSAGREDISVEGEAKVGQGLHDSVNFVAVCGTALVVAASAVGLGHVVRLLPVLTFVLAVLAFATVLTIGLRRTATRKRNRGPGRRPRR